MYVLCGMLEQTQMLEPHTIAFGITKAVKYCDCGEKHMIVSCNNLVTEEKKCDGFL